MGWLTRAEAARSLGVSVGTVRRAEGSLLHPARGDDGTWYLDPREVEASRPDLSRRKTEPPARPAGQADGDLAVILFPLFERGASWNEAVISTKLAPATVRALYWEWAQGFKRHGPAETDDGEPIAEPGGSDDDRGLTLPAWEAEMRALEREQERLDRLARARRQR